LATGLTDEQADVVIDLCRERRLTWRVTSIWATSPDEVTIPTTSVIDGGDAGLWFVEVERPDDPETTLTLLPTKPSGVWRRLLLLLPSSDPTKGAHA
jgi:hypothetical protein